MFAAYKENAAKRKAARAANNAQFRARMAAIREQEELNKLSIEAARLANKDKLLANLSENNARFREVWER